MESKKNQQKIPIPFLITTLLTLLVLLIACLVTTILWKQTLPSIYWQAFFLLEFLLITAFTRSLSLIRVFSFFLLGAGLTSLIILVFSFPIQLVLGEHNNLTGDVFVPIIEETIKPLPLVLLLFFPRSRLRMASGLSDFLLGGIALGGGFNFVEDLLRAWDWNKMLLYRAGPHIGPMYLFPTMDSQVLAYGRNVPLLPVAYLGHGAAVGLICLCLGFAYIYGRKGLGRLLWVLPLIAWIGVIWDHIIFNISSQGPLQGWQDMVSLIFGLRGNLAPWVFFLLVVIAVVLDAVVLIKYFRSHSETTVSFQKLSIFKPFKINTILLDLWLLLKSIRLTRVLAYKNRLSQPSQKLNQKMMALKHVLEG